MAMAELGWLLDARLLLLFLCLLLMLFFGVLVGVLCSSQQAKPRKLSSRRKKKGRPQNNRRRRDRNGIESTAVSGDSEEDSSSDSSDGEPSERTRRRGQGAAGSSSAAASNSTDPPAESGEPGPPRSRKQTVFCIVGDEYHKKIDGWSELCGVLQALYSVELSARHLYVADHLEMQYLDESQRPVLVSLDTTSIVEVLNSAAILLSDKPVAALVAANAERMQDEEDKAPNADVELDRPGRKRMSMRKLRLLTMREGSGGQVEL